METAQDKFNIAKKNYEKAIECIDAIAEICQKAQPIEKQDLRSQFDIILQVFLLRCSVSNGHLSNAERQFIEHLVENSDTSFRLNVAFQFFWSSSLWSQREMPAITGTRTAAHMKNERASSKGLEMPLTDTQMAIKK